MNLYVSTSRKPSQLTRKLARLLALLLAAEYENRGKRSVADCVERARARGLTRLLFVYERNGNPSELAFLDSDVGWLEPSILVGGVDASAPKRGRLPREARAKAVDEFGKRVTKLFDLEDAEEGEDAIVLVAGKREIAFEVDGERVGPAIKISGFREGGGERE